MNPKRLWSLWLSLTLDIAIGFTRPGRLRFVEWATSLALNVEEHTITQSLVGIDRPQDWKALESFAEYGSWDLEGLQSRCGQVVSELPHSLWYGYHVWAGDDTKVHRNSPGVWGTCTFHNYSARYPNRAETVRAHNWVVLGGLVPTPDQPATFLPVSGRLYFRKSQLPAGETFHTKNDLLVDTLRQQAKVVKGLHLGVFDGAYAVANVVRPLVRPKDGSPRIDFLTRLRNDARLFGFAPTQRPKGKRGPMPKWGRPLSPPRCGGRWPGEWQEGQVFLYGRTRKVRWKEMICLWRVLGHTDHVKVVVAEVEGYSQRFSLVSSAVGLTGLQMVELFCARFRQEDGFRDLKQRLGWEECRAWTKNPIVRTTQTLFETLTLMRLLLYRLDAEVGENWWLHPEWNKRKTRPSVLDVERVLRRNEVEIRQCLSEWLESEGETEGSDRAKVPR
jgi:DDE superfamily endonuclease